MCACVRMCKRMCVPWGCAVKASTAAVRVRVCVPWERVGVCGDSKYSSAEEGFLTHCVGALHMLLHSARAAGIFKLPVHSPTAPHREHIKGKE